MSTQRQTPARAWIYSGVDTDAAQVTALASDLDAAGVPVEVLPTGHESAVWALRETLDGRPAAHARLLAFLDLDGPEARVFNEFCVSRQLPLLIINTAEGLSQIGPAVLPGRTPCVACFESHARHFPAWAQRGDPAAPRTWWPAWSARVAAEARSFLVGNVGSALSGGHVLRPDPCRSEARSYRIFKNPACTICSVFAVYSTEDWSGAARLTSTL
jgi:hypothetical protein